MNASVRRVFALRSSDRALLLEALTIIIVLRVCLPVLPLTTVREYLERIVRWHRAWPRWHRASALSDHLADERITWAVGAMGRRVRGTTCLIEALTAHCMLTRHGRAPALRIGVKRGDAMSLDAHAWVECDGAVVIGRVPALAEYAVLS